MTFYSTTDGEQPLAKWLKDLKIRQPIPADLSKAGLGKLRDSNQHKPKLVEWVDMQARIRELRVVDANIARVFFFYDSDEVICTNGYVKKQQALDQGELARARRYQQDWMGRKQP